jgi:hypothetical protein
LTGDWATFLRAGGLLALAGAIGLLMAWWFSGILYRAGWIQASARRRQAKSAGLRVRIPGFSVFTSAVIVKDWRMRTRDLAQLARFVMPLLFLLVLFAFRSQGLAELVSRLGAGPVAAIAGVFPAWVLLLSLSSGLALSAVSLEGKAIWIFYASPNSLRRLLLAKCWSAGLPAILLSLLVGVAGELFIRPGWGWAAGALFLLTLGGGGLVAGMVGLGAVWARFDWHDARRMIHPAAAMIGIAVQFGLSGFWALFTLGSPYFASWLHLPAGMVWSVSLLVSVLVAAGVAALALVLGGERLNSAELTA